VYHQRQDKRQQVHRGERGVHPAASLSLQVWQVIIMLLTAIMAYLKAVTDRNWRPPSPVKAEQGSAAAACARRLGECGMSSKSKYSVACKCETISLPWKQKTKRIDSILMTCKPVCLMKHM
jgi:hypothetical protein